MLRIVLLIFSLTFASAVAADCPDRPTTCNTATFGWQGTCFKDFKCKDCGPEHCPEQPMLDVAKSKALLDGSGGQKCRENLIELKYAPNGSSACSIPDKVKNAFGMASLVFGKSACVEHDICYAMDGMNRSLCDTMFLDNMLRSCKTYYYDHLGKRDAIKELNGLGYGHCRVAAGLFYAGVALGGENSFNPSNTEKKACKNANGVPKLATRFHLTGGGSNDRVKVTSIKGGSSKPGKVKVCLRNKSNRWTAMHFKQADKPKYIAKKKNDTSCGHYSPGEKTFYFWQKLPLVNTQMVRGNPMRLDISEYADYRINLDWYEG